MDLSILTIFPNTKKTRKSPQKPKKISPQRIELKKGENTNNDKFFFFFVVDPHIIFPA